MLTRRQFLNTCSTAVGAGLSSHYAIANTSKKSLDTLDTDIIRHVNQLTKGENIELTLLYPKGSLANLQPTIARFSTETSVSIRLKEVGVDDINSTIIFKHAQKQHAFDIALPATFGIPDLVSAQALAPLSAFVEKYEPANYKQHQLYDYGDYVNGKFYGYQTDGDTYLMFYNKDMLDNAANQQAFQEKLGYTLAIPNTWQQLDDMIQFFHQPEKSQYGGCLFRIPGYGAWEWWSRFHAKGYFPFDEQLEPQINNAAGIQALQEMINTSSYLHPKAATDGLFENWETFSKGETFCNIGWGGSQKYFNSDTSAIKNKLYFSPTPGGVINGQSISCPIFNWGWNYVVSSLCPHKEIAYLFTLFACSPVMSTLAVQKNGYFDPFREEHYGDPIIEETYSKAFLNAHKTSMKNSIPDFYIQNQSAYLSVLQENIYLAYKGSLTAKQALDVTASEWKVITARVGKETQMAIWASLKQKYPEKLAQLLK